MTRENLDQVEGRTVAPGERCRFPGLDGRQRARTGGVHRRGGAGGWRRGLKRGGPPALEGIGLETLNMAWGPQRRIVLPRKYDQGQAGLNETYAR